jgi:hypothetical protein
MRLKMILQISLVGMVSTLVLAGGTWLVSTMQLAASALFGGVLVTLNLLIIYWTIKQIFSKKSVALAIALIVFKYAILLSLFLLLYRSGWRIDEGFVVGLLAMFPTILVFVRKHLKSSEQNGPL